MRSATRLSNIREHCDDAGTEITATKRGILLAQVCYAVLLISVCREADATITKTLLIRATTAMFLNDFSM
jgi:hypothetical protein